MKPSLLTISNDPQELKEELEKVYTRAIKYLSYRNRSEKETRDHLLKKKIPEDLINPIIKLLREHKFLDDRKFAEWWIEQRQEFKGKSKMIIKSELFQKGVDKLLIEELLDNNQGDLKTATLIYKKNKYKFDRIDGEERKNKIANFLRLKGYNWDIIEKILQNEED